MSAVCCVLAATLALTGCDPARDPVPPLPTADDGMRPAAVRDDLRAQLDGIEEALGGTWFAQDGSLPELCGETGDAYRYAGGRNRNELVADTASAATTVEGRLSARGYTDIRVRSFTEDSRLVSATSPAGVTIDLTIDRGKTHVRAETACRAGDYAAIRAKDLDALRADQAAGVPTSPSTPPAGSVWAR